MNQNRLCDAVKKIAWAYILLHVHINLGTINILPNWAGYFMILSVLPVIGEEEKTANLLAPLAKILAATEMISWINVGFLENMLKLEYVTIFTTAISLYFHFQLLTNLASISRKYGCSQIEKLLRLRTVNTLLTTFYAVVDNFYTVEWVEYTLIALTFVWVIVTIWICSVLFSFKKELEKSLPVRNEVSV